MKRKMLSVLLSLSMVVSLVPFAVFAEGDEADPQGGGSELEDGVISDVSYVERSWNGTEVVLEEKTSDAIAVPDDGSMTSGWYYLNSDVTVSGRIELEGDVYLILGDGFTLDVKGLYIPQGSTLTIYGQSDGEEAGKIYSHPSGGAGIGGYSGHDNGNIVIHGGTIEATGYDNCAGIGTNDGKTGGSITIYGGDITAKGGSNGAGIGGGRNCSGGTITVYGGNITANGPTGDDTSENGAGIGGGDCGAGGTIVIYGGTITTYSRDGAGIGGGDDGDGGDITINGGTITSIRVNMGQGARIGGGCDAAPGTITINDGTITTDGGSGAGIGGGKGNTAGGSVTINGGVISTSGDYGIGSGSGGADVAVTLNYTDTTKDSICINASSFHGTVTLMQPFGLYNGNILVQAYGTGTVTNQWGNVCLKAYDDTTFDSVSYTEYSWDETTGRLSTTDKTIDNYFVVTSDLLAQYPAGLTSGNYVVKENTTINDYVYIRKDCTVNLIVPSGVTLTCEKGIGCGYDENGHYATLNIFGTGKIVTTGQDLVAGIGGKDNEASGNIAIHGTNIEATGGEGGAGIGGGDGGKDPDGTTSIKIYAGTITATGGKYGAGIGGGDEQPGAHTYIYGGKITASSKEKGAGIGGGDEEGTLGIFIYGGEITAIGGKHGAGIGAGEEGGNLRKAEDGGGVNIFGGSVYAEGGSGAAGIGGGFYENMSGTVTISGNPSDITVLGGKGAAGIGAGDGDDGVYSPAEGDMKGNVTIDCEGSGLITITGGEKGAGIGAGYCGNMDGKVYIRNGNILVYGGNCAAGIGGGLEAGFGAGSSGGDVYIGGGTLHVYSGGGQFVLVSESDDGPAQYKESDAEAIGYGGQNVTFEESGSVYISSSNNKTGNYMRVAYKKYDSNSWTTAKSGDRSKKCHQEQCELYITVCDHTEYGTGNSGLTYSAITDTTHTAKCKHCGYTVTENHTFDVNGVCACGYSNGSVCVVFDSNGGSEVEMQVVSSGGKATRPADPEMENFEFVDWYQVIDGTMASEPFDFTTAISESISLKAQWKHEHDGKSFQLWDTSNSLPYSGSYVLMEDITLDSKYWFGNNTIDLCLNGHTLTRYNDSDSVITASGRNGILNLYDDGDGLITRANCTYILNVDSGTINMYGGTISGTSHNGVYVYGKFNMYGGSVSGNGEYGVYVDANGTFKVSGDVRVTGNGAGNVYLESGKKIQIAGALGADSRIGVTMAEPGVFTSGLNANGASPKGTAANFFSDNDQYEVVINANGEAELVERSATVTVTFEPGDVTTDVEMDDVSVSVGASYTLPECEYVVNGKAFVEWSVVIGTADAVRKQPGDTITVTADTTVTAVWEGAPAFTGHSVLLEEGKIGLKFFMDLSMLTEAERSDGYMTFEIAGKGSVTADHVPSSDTNSAGDYGFVVEMNAIQMADEVTATFHYQKNGVEKTVVEKYSVKQYCIDFENSTIQKDEKEIALTKALADYGHYLQLYLKGIRGWQFDPETGYTQMDTFYNEYTSEDTSALKADAKVIPITRDILSSDIKAITYSMTFDSDTCINIYFEMTDGAAYNGAFEVKFAGAETTWTPGTEKLLSSGETVILEKCSDGRYRLKITGIYAQHLDDVYTISVNTASTVQSDGNAANIELCGLSYARSLAENSTSEGSDEAAVAIYRYYLAAKEYVG